MYQLPTPRMQKAYRFFIEAGADAVINHHQHCYSGYEYYQGKPIVYGLGNFCFDWKGKTSKIWFKGYMAKLLFEDSHIIVTPMPYRQCDEIPSVRCFDAGEARFKENIKALNDIISDESRLKEEYQKLLQRTWKSYDVLNPYSNKYMNWLYKRNLLPTLMPIKRLYSILNIIRCESHQERFLDAIERKLHL